MQTHNVQRAVYKRVATLASLLFLFMPLAVSAEVIPLAPLPTNFGTETETLGGYVNTLFFLVIGVGATLAVLRIIAGGFKYMTSEAVTGTKDAKTVITMAIVGLLLLLGSWLILSVINPQINSLSALDFSNLENTAPVNFQIKASQTKEEKQEVANLKKKEDAEATCKEKGKVVDEIQTKCVWKDKNGCHLPITRVTCK